MVLSRSEFAHLLPHAGSMSLLDRVLAYDAERLHATAQSHRAADNPLRREGQLSPCAGIEYAAQAMAVHGALRAGGGAARQGFLALAREITWTVARLDDIPADLDIHIHQLALRADSAMYEFSLAALGRVLVAGRAAVFFPEEAGR
ncbi:hydroxymyristoyl-ACP dehydratase [Methylomagnum ishizawai]|uniref:hydroxymyristoyl-ACP dehydratase n=1 Tax=Methylomagnum ishizawai TaxID=1760988 RepID=UPI001C3368FD|nr:hydroxymyristoyl-ACP dehydratase [Methylomagnum ishizawai]BBL72931.1 3-hydroxylacyl-ACP dehydratase [Methylomagnum ishizawai]